MLSVDSNLLLYSLVEDCPEHAAAIAFMEPTAQRSDVAVSEFVLVELYTLLRNPIVVARPLSAAGAMELIQAFRKHPLWRLLSFPAAESDVMDNVWRFAAQPGTARLRIFDTRLALTLRRHGVTEFATRNVKDFQGFGFKRVWDPLA